MAASRASSAQIVRIAGSVLTAVVASVSGLGLMREASKVSTWSHLENNVPISVFHEAECRL